MHRRLRQLALLHGNGVGQRRRGHPHVGQRAAQHAALAAEGLHVAGGVVLQPGVVPCAAGELVFREADAVGQRAPARGDHLLGRVVRKAQPRALQLAGSHGHRIRRGHASEIHLGQHAAAQPRAAAAGTNILGPVPCALDLCLPQLALGARHGVRQCRTSHGNDAVGFVPRDVRLRVMPFRRVQQDTVGGRPAGHLQ